MTTKTNKTEKNLNKSFEMLQKIVSPMMDQSILFSFITSREDRHINESNY